MKEIVLLCQYGASTGLLTTNMLKEAQKQNIEVNINAYAEYQLDSILKQKDVDVVLLGPQIRFKKRDFDAKYKDKGIEFLVIDALDYGTMNGKKVLEEALKHCK
jgi:hypothetical protein